MTTWDEVPLSEPAWDAHQHVDFGDYSVDPGEAVEWLRADADLRVAVMDDANIDHTLLLPSYDYDKRDGTLSTARVIEGLVRYQGWHPRRFSWLGCTVEPQHYAAAAQLLDETLAGGAFRVASWHNRYQGLSVDARIMFEFVEIAASHDCVVYLHNTADLDHEEAWRIARIVRSFPHARFVVVDAMMTNTSIQAITDLLATVDNVWIDTAGAIAFVHLIRHMVTAVGWERVLFGSDYYAQGRGGTPRLMRHQLHLAGLDHDNASLVFRRNLESLLGPPASRTGT